VHWIAPLKNPQTNPLKNLKRHASSLPHAVTEKTRDTNCPVEKWFGIVQHSIMGKIKIKMTPGTFIRKMYPSLQARYKEHGIQHNLSQGLLLKPVPPMDVGEPHETWKRKEARFPVRKSKSYSAPHTVPVPHKKPHNICSSNNEGSAHDPCNVPADVTLSEKEVRIIIT